MDKIGTFEQFLATNTAQFSLLNYGLNIMLTALLAFLLGMLYNRYGNSLSNRKSFSKNFFLLAITTMLVITIVKSSLALSLGLVGALSIVRFRAAIKEPEELSYLFLNIAIGLGFGADQKAATIFGFLFISIILIIRGEFSNKKFQENKSLIVTISVEKPEENQADRIVDILKKFSQNLNLKRIDENTEILEMSFISDIEDYEKINQARIQIRKNFDNTTFSVIDNNIVI